VLNGNVGVIKSSLGELSDQTNEARAFSYLPPSWTLGAALGPIIGGFLADPAKNYPEYFGKSTFFLKYRYALPCFVGAIFPIIGIVVGILFLEEVSRDVNGSVVDLPLTAIFEQSLPNTKRRKSLGDNESGDTQVKQELPGVRSVLTRRVCLTLTNYAMLAFTSISNVGIFPLFLFTSVRLGGLGFSERQVR
jgi:MFS family permease